MGAKPATVAPSFSAPHLLREEDHTPYPILHHYYYYYYYYYYCRLPTYYLLLSHVCGVWATLWTVRMHTCQRQGRQKCLALQAWQADVGIQFRPTPESPCTTWAL